MEFKKSFLRFIVCVCVFLFHALCTIFVKMMMDWAVDTMDLRSRWAQVGGWYDDAHIARSLIHKNVHRWRSGIWQHWDTPLSSAVPAWFPMSGHDLLQTAGSSSCNEIAIRTDPMLALRVWTFQCRSVLAVCKVLLVKDDYVTWNCCALNMSDKEWTVAGYEDIKPSSAVETIKRAK